MNEKQLAFSVLVLKRSAMLSKHRADSSSICDFSVDSQMSCAIGIEIYLEHFQLLYHYYVNEEIFTLRTSTE